MYTLPITCKQLSTVILCAIFASGIYLMWYSYLDFDHIWVFTLGMFVTGFPTVVGMCYFIWYSYAFLNKNVRCKCEE